MCFCSCLRNITLCHTAAVSLSSHSVGGEGGGSHVSSTHPAWDALIGEVVERDALVAEAEPPGDAALVLDLVVVDAVRRQALHQLHVAVEHTRPTMHRQALMSAHNRARR